MFINKPSIVSYVVAGGGNIFPFEFKFYADTDIRVLRTPLGQVADDDTDLLAVTDYTINSNASKVGGDITVTIALTDGDIVTVQRSLPITRKVEYTKRGSFTASNVNDDNDYQTYLILDQFALTETYLKVPVGNVGSGVDFTFPSPEASKFIGWNPAGNRLENKTVGENDVEINIVNVDFIGDLPTVDEALHKTVNVRGYNTYGDGGGGMFTYDSTKVGDNDGGTIINGWVRQYSGAVNIKWFGAVGDGAVDDTVAIQNCFALGKSVYAPKGVYIITDEVELNSNQSLLGDGAGTTEFKFFHLSNPISSSFLLSMKNIDNVTVANISLTTNLVYNDGIFDVGTYDSGTKLYTGGNDGNINGLLISSCSNVNVDNVEVTGFNYHGIRVSTEGITDNDYNRNLIFNNVHGHENRVSALSILGTIDFKVTNCTFTDNGSFQPTYIDGGLGYGVVLGRQGGVGTHLRTFGGVCSGNFCARNARHGIDTHQGANIVITDNIIEDNFLIGIAVQDLDGSADDSMVGDITVSNNIIYQTSWVESRYPLITYKDVAGTPTERDDSTPIYIYSDTDMLKNILVTNNSIYNWRYRQIITNTITDLSGSIFVSAVNNINVSNNTVTNDRPSFYPASVLTVAGDALVISGNRFISYQRCTVYRPMYSYNASSEAIVNGNHFEVKGVYSDTAGTDASYPTKRIINGELVFVGNTIIQSTQAGRGSIWYPVSSSDNYDWGFNLNGSADEVSVNRGNLLKIGGTTLIEYGSVINDSLEVYVSSTGGTILDGMTSATAFKAETHAELLTIIRQLPRCKSGLIINILDTLDFTADGTNFITIPDWQDDITFRGDSADNTLSISKTAGINSNSTRMFQCSEKSNNINFEYLLLQTNHAGGIFVIENPADVKWCAIKSTSTVGAGVVNTYKTSLVSITAFEGAGSGTCMALRASLGGNVVSQGNGDGATQFAYGLNANSGAIYKNGTQPTGSTSNELAQNGGTIA